jgi:hypothetical protein
VVEWDDGVDSVLGGDVVVHSTVSVASLTGWATLHLMTRSRRLHRREASLLGQMLQKSPLT